MSLSRPTVLDFSASTPTSKYKPLRLRGLAFVGMTRISDKKFLAFRNLPDFQEFEMLMKSASFKERIQHDRVMRAKHVQTMQELFGISPEEEEEMHGPIALEPDDYLIDGSAGNVETPVVCCSRYGWEVSVALN